MRRDLLASAKSLLTRRPVAASAAVASCLFSAAALGLPWDVDMADSQAKDGYTCWEYTTNDAGERICADSMRTLPEGVVSQPNILTPNAYTVDYDKMDERWATLTNPVASSPEALATGERMYAIYCTPCHGKVVNNGIPELGNVSKAGLNGVVGLVGATGVLKDRTDGHVYRVIRKGNAIMPAYGWAMTDQEMWSLVHYLRTLNGGAYVPPAPAEDAEASQ